MQEGISTDFFLRIFGRKLKRQRNKSFVSDFIIYVMVS
jgi:hypothetical protein